MDCIVHGVRKSRTQLNDFHFHFFSDKYDIFTMAQESQMILTFWANSERLRGLNASAM